MSTAGGLERFAGESSVMHNLDPDFIVAIGESFSDNISPPVPGDDASPHECCEVVISVLGGTLDVSDFACITTNQVTALAQRFGEYFDCDCPSDSQIRYAIEALLTRLT